MKLINKLTSLALKRLLGCALCLTSMHAAAESLEALVVYPRAGQEIVFMLKDHPVFSYVGENLTVESADAKAELHLADVESLTFETRELPVPSSAMAAEAERLGIDMSNSDAVTVYGLAAGEELCAFTISGHAIGTFKADDSGKAVVPLEYIACGHILIIKYNSSTIKIMRK